ncbi:MAG: 2-oxoisovalerate dehydrogenase [Phycisphaerales bacterium]|nr:2-oxoisovalerate dehydrogenase [Phycisphaerales bacterium]
MTEIVFTVEEDPSGGFVAHAAGAAIHTQGDTIDELREAVCDAVKCHFEDSQRPRLIWLHYVRDEVIAA